MFDTIPQALTLLPPKQQLMLMTPRLQKSARRETIFV
jgi:hypothetical protein